MASGRLKAYAAAGDERIEELRGQLERADEFAGRLRRETRRAASTRHVRST